MPKADKLFLKWRDEEFARDMHGMSNAELARKYKLTTRHVLNLKRQCNGLDDAPGTQPGQISLGF
jgi:Mor family transcriptional regulator